MLSHCTNVENILETMMTRINNDTCNAINTCEKRSVGYTIKLNFYVKIVVKIYLIKIR